MIAATRQKHTLQGEWVGSLSLDKVKYGGENFCCKQCEHREAKIEVQVFRDKTSHHRIVCSWCGKFNGYQKQDKVDDKLMVRKLKQFIGEPITHTTKDEVFKIVNDWWNEYG